MDLCKSTGRHGPLESTKDRSKTCIGLVMLVYSARQACTGLLCMGLASDQPAYEEASEASGYLPTWPFRDEAGSMRVGQADFCSYCIFAQTMRNRFFRAVTGLAIAAPRFYRGIRPPSQPLGSFYPAKFTIPTIQIDGETVKV
jgi:hypothetical protein